MKAATVVWIDIFVCISDTNPVYYSFVFVRGVSDAIEGTVLPKY